MNMKGEGTGDAGSLSSYFDLRSMIVENDKKQKLLQHLVEQQVQLQNLQDRQKVLLEAQQHFAKLDYIANNDLKEKLGRLQSVRGRISQLQDMVETTEPADTSQSLLSEPTNVELDDSLLQSEHSFALNKSIDPEAVNQQLEQLYSTVSDLLVDIDGMNVLKATLGEKTTPLREKERADVAEKHHQHSLNSRSVGGGDLGDLPVSPLPYVKLIETEKDSSPVGGKARSRVKKSPHFKANSDGMRLDASYVERHYEPDNIERSGKKSSSESSFDESNALAKPTAELWNEMKYYQKKLAELKQKREELSALMKFASSENDNKSSEINDLSSVASGYNSVKQEPEKCEDENEENEARMRWLLNQLKPDNVDAITEKTSATWGGSTSTSGDESVGFISKPVVMDVEKRDEMSISASMNASVEEHVYQLWDALEYYCNFLHILFDDQKALSILLQNTLSVQNGRHVNSVLYGISPDFLIYQLDNCSAQIMAYQKHIVLLHKELSQVQAQHPEFDISYSPSARPYKSFYSQNGNFSQTGTSNLQLLSGEKDFTQELSKSSTPLRYATELQDGMKSKLELSYNASPASSPKKEMMKAYLANNSETQKAILDISPHPRAKSMQNNNVSEGASSRNVYDVSPVKKTTLKFQAAKATEASQKPRVNDTGTSSATKNFKPFDAKHDVATSTTKANALKAVVDFSDVDSNTSGHPLFEALRDSIYSEAATLISQNESRPHFLIELFHELQQLNSDYLRQHCLFVIRDMVNGYLIESPKQKKVEKKKSPDAKKKIVHGTPSTYADLMSDMKSMFSENTPSESEANSECDNMQMWQGPRSTQYDYVLDVTSGSELTSPIDSSGPAAVDNDAQNPFEADYLGSTVIHLDEALQRVREMERMEQERNNASTKTDEREESVTVKTDALVNGAKLDSHIKHVITQIIPKIKLHDEVCTGEKVGELCDIVTKLVTNEHVPNCDGDKDFGSQLESVLSQCLSKFLGYHLSECGEELIIDVSEVLFNELAYLYMINDVDDDNDDDDEEEEEEDDDILERTETSTQTVVEIVADGDFKEDGDSEDQSESSNDEDESESVSKSTRSNHPEKGNESVVLDLSVSETKPLTSYGSGEDEEEGSGEDYDEFNESDVPTSMQHDESCPNSAPNSSRENSTPKKPSSKE